MKKNTPKISKNLAKYATASAADVLVMLDSSKLGLNELEAEHRRRKWGENLLVIAKTLPGWRRFINLLISPLIIILFIIGSVSILLGDYRSGFIVYAMILLSALTDYWQERKSEQAANKLKERIVTKVEVWRGRRSLWLPAKDLVPGDIISLSVGSMIPADCRIIEADDFFVNESALTGESFPVAKSAEGDKQFSSLNSGCLLFAGTDVSSGYAKAVVVVTGNRTVIGRLSSRLAEPDGKTDFELGVAAFGRLVVKVIICLVVGIFVVNTGLAGKNLLSSLMFSLALAVGLTPELLPMIMSVSLASGSRRMAKHGVIVKRLNAIHDFGGMDILCTDKTGTLTENHIKLVKAVDILGQESKILLDYTYINSYFQSGISNPLDEAILEIKKRSSTNGWHKVDETPFDFQRRRLAVILSKAEERWLVAKGAPESFWYNCDRCLVDGEELAFDDQHRRQAIACYEDLSRDGFRVLAVAVKRLATKQQYGVDDEQDMLLVGLVAFLDPPKLGSKKAIDALESQNIAIKVITGDNELVSAKICRQMDIPIAGMLTGDQLDRLDGAELLAAVNKTTLFARVNPEQKERIVSALRAGGHCVGYLGDGINDSLPLKAADVGISVNNAVDVAKEAADLILLNKDLGVLSLGVQEGRRTFGNTMKYIFMGLSSNFGNMFSVAAASFVLPFLPMLPIQILLNNFIYDFSQLGIPTDNVDDSYLFTPKKWNLNFIKRFMLTFGPISSLFDILTFWIMLRFFQADQSLFQTAWFMESLATQILVIFVIRTHRLPFVVSRPSGWLTLSTLGLLSLGLAVPFTPLADYFGFVRPSWQVVLMIIVIVGSYLLATELAKRPLYKKYLS